MSSFPIVITAEGWHFEGTAEGLTYSEDLRPTTVLNGFGEVVDFNYDAPPIRKGSVTIHGAHAIPTASGRTLVASCAGGAVVRLTGVKITETRAADGNVVVDFEWEERSVV